MTSNATYALLMQVVEDNGWDRGRLKQWRRRAVPFKVRQDVMIKAAKFGVAVDVSVFENFREAEQRAKEKAA